MKKYVDLDALKERSAFIGVQDAVGLVAKGEVTVSIRGEDVPPEGLTVKVGRRNVTVDHKSCWLPSARRFEPRIRIGFAAVNKAIEESYRNGGVR